MEPLMIMLFVFGGAAVLFYVGYGVYRFVTVMNRTLENENTLRSTERATVLSKRIDSDNLDMKVAAYDGGTCHYGTFETESGLVLDLTMGRSDYGGLQPGDTGLLHWSGTRLELFENDRKKTK